MTTEEIMKTNNLDAMFFFSPENRFWLTDFCSSLSFLLVVGQKKYLFVDGRYITDAQKKITDKQIEVRIWKNWENIKGFCQEKNIRRLGFEKEYVTVSQLEK
jgi:Xaa-Pro aminopeptidase